MEINYNILIVCGINGSDNHYPKIIDLIKKYCDNTTIDINQVHFECLNVEDDHLRLCDIYNEYKLIPEFGPDCYNSEITETEKRKLLEFNNGHDYYYDYIIFEHCNYALFDIEHVKYFNMLKLNGYLLLF